MRLNARAAHTHPDEETGSLFTVITTFVLTPRLWHRAGLACNAKLAEPAALPPQQRVKSKAQTLAELTEENDWKNDVVLFWLPQEFRCAANPAGGPAQSSTCGSLEKLHRNDRPVRSCLMPLRACTLC